MMDGWNIFFLFKKNFLEMKSACESNSLNEDEDEDEERYIV